MVARTVLATLAGSAPDQRLQVALHSKSEGGLAIALTEQHFAEGLGWYDQRTLTLDPRQFRQLQAVLGSAASPLIPADSLDSDSDPNPVILPFPGPREPICRRPAIGDGT